MLSRFSVFLLGASISPLLTSTLADGAQDFRDLGAIINSVADAIWGPLNSTNGAAVNIYRGSGLLATLEGTLSTADLVANLTGSILRSKFNLDVDQAAFVNNTPAPMDNQYGEYINSIPNLSSALTALGRSWHVDLNAPVYLAMESLAQTLHGYSSDLLQASLITTSSTIDTIRAASRIADAQTAWSKPLNLPGTPSSSSGSNTNSPSSQRGPFSPPFARRHERYHRRTTIPLPAAAAEAARSGMEAEGKRGMLRSATDVQRSLNSMVRGSNGQFRHVVEDLPDDRATESRDYIPPNAAPIHRAQRGRRFGGSVGWWT